jgi:hypothetical protein
LEERKLLDEEESFGTDGFLKRLFLRHPPLVYTVDDADDADEEGD